MVMNKKIEGTPDNNPVLPFPWARFFVNIEDERGTPINRNRQGHGHGFGEHNGQQRSQYGGSRYGESRPGVNQAPLTSSRQSSDPADVSFTKNLQDKRLWRLNKRDERKGKQEVDLCDNNGDTACQIQRPKPTIPSKPNGA